MAIFRTQEHLPDVYPRKSRDFQVLCNLFDLVNSSIKYDIDSMKDILDVDECNDRLLNYLQTKLGFFTQIKLTAYEQRIILKAFPYLVRDKGSSIGIKEAIQVFLKSQKINGRVNVLIKNKEKDPLKNIYLVRVALQTPFRNLALLKDLLKYIIPAGYLIDYIFFNPVTNVDKIMSSDSIKIIIVNENLNGGVVPQFGDVVIGENLIPPFNIEDEVNTDAYNTYAVIQSNGKWQRHYNYNSSILSKLIKIEPDTSYKFSIINSDGNRVFVNYGYEFLSKDATDISPTGTTRPAQGVNEIHDPGGIIDSTPPYLVSGTAGGSSYSSDSWEIIIKSPSDAENFMFYMQSYTYDPNQDPLEGSTPYTFKLEKCNDDINNDINTVSRTIIPEVSSEEQESYTFEKISGTVYDTYEQQSNEQQSETSPSEE